MFSSSPGRASRCRCSRRAAACLSRTLGGGGPDAVAECRQPVEQYGGSSAARACRLETLEEEGAHVLTVGVAERGWIEPQQAPEGAFVERRAHEARRGMKFRSRAVLTSCSSRATSATIRRCPSAVIA